MKSLGVRQGQVQDPAPSLGECPTLIQTEK